ncbi:MAG: FapA family protein, partial [Proteobacteria bacterium]|nr:FapA family protein [Pseudomonadota bacterium]
MFFAPKLIVTYNSRLKRARVQFQVGECLKARRPPSYAFDKVREKFEEELEDGHIESYEIFEKRFVSLWLHLREQVDNLSANKIIRVTLGQGARTYSEIIVKPSSVAGALADLSCQFSERKAKTISYNAFVFHIIRQLQALDIQIKPDGAQLRYVYLLMKSGQPLQHWALLPQLNPEDYPGESFLVTLDPEHHFASLHIFNKDLLQHLGNAELFYQKAKRKLEHLQAEGLRLTHLKEHTLEKIRSLHQKAAAFGYGLPYSLLIAFNAEENLRPELMNEEKQLANEVPSEDLARWKVRVGAIFAKQRSEYFDIEVDRSHMLAKIVSVRAKPLAAVRDQVSADWLIHECHKQGLVFGYDEFLDGIVAAIKRGESLPGMTIAQGLSPKSGHTAYLHESFRDPVAPESFRGEALRDRQNSRLARNGQLIGEIRFSDGVPGRTVLGQEIHALGSAFDAKIVCGDGVISRETGRFHATRDGLIELNAGKLSCLAAYTHQGNVNLSSGNLAFEGSLIIQGDIEAGASVEVNGSLLVQGRVGPSIVKVRGDLEVQGGIVTTSSGFVAVSRHCHAEFIENSRLEVQGILEVNRSILNSQVVCADLFVFRNSVTGLISGGEVSCWSAITVCRLGMPEGQKTICRIGSHHKAELRRLRLAARLDAISLLRDQLLKQQEAGAPLATKKAEEFRTKKETIQSKLTKAVALIKHIGLALEELEKTLLTNSQATLTVTGLLDSNVEIYGMGKLIPI